MPTRGVILLCTACNMTPDRLMQWTLHNMVAKFGDRNWPAAGEFETSCHLHHCAQARRQRLQDVGGIDSVPHVVVHIHIRLVDDLGFQELLQATNTTVLQVHNEHSRRADCVPLSGRMRQPVSAPLVCPPV